MEDNSEVVKIGKAIHEEKASGRENSEIEVENNFFWKFFIIYKNDFNYLSNAFGSEN